MQSHSKTTKTRLESLGKVTDSLDLFKQFIETIPEGIICISFSGKVTSINETYLKIMEIKRKEIEGKSGISLAKNNLKGRTLSLILKLINRSLKKESKIIDPDINFDINFKTKSGKEKVLSIVKIKKLKFGIVSIVSDITKIRQMEQKDKQIKLFQELRTDMWALAADQLIRSEKELIKKLFKLVGERMKPSRICLNKINEKKDAVNILEWVKKGQKPSRKNSKIPYNLWKKFIHKPYVQFTPDGLAKLYAPGKMLAPFRLILKQIIKKDGIKNLLCFAYKVNNVFEALVTMDWCENDDKQWSQGEIYTGFDMCKILSTKIAKMRAENSAQKNRKRIHQSNILLNNLINFMKFVGNISTKIHGVLDEIEIYNIVNKEFIRSKQYHSSIVLLCDNNKKIKVVEAAVPQYNLKTIEKKAKKKMKNATVPLIKSRSYSQVINEGKTIQTTDLDLLKEVRPWFIVKIIVNKQPDTKKRKTVLTPIYQNEKIIGALSVSSEDLTELYIQSVKTLANHISSALEMADENIMLIMAQDGLLRNIEKYLDLYDNAPDMYASIDMETTNVIQCNETLLKNTGYSYNDVIGEPISNLCHPDCHEYLKTEVFPLLLKSGEVKNTHLQLIRKDKSKIEVSLNITAVKDIKGDIIFARSSWRDITRQKKLQDQLIRAEKLSAVGQLASGIAHEFNNILAIIRGNTQLFLPEVTDNEELTVMLKTIETQTKRGAEIVRRMSAFARPGEMNKEICNIKEIIEDVLKLEKEFMKLENIQIEKNYSCNKKINVDKGQMGQIFLNLINNARHAIMPEGKGLIRISINEVNNRLEIQIKDNGTGMDEEVKRNIFNPFFTTKGALAKDRLGIKGTGLGLSVSHSIIQNHDGTIHVESEKGKGTTFIITLPIAESIKIKKKSKTGETAVKESIKIKKLNILVVDDEKEITDYLSGIFKKVDHNNAVVVNSGRKALSAFRRKSFDLVFLDMLLPDMNGEEIFKEMKKISPRIPVIFISGQIDIERNKIKQKGAYAFLQKPFDIDEIFRIINKIVEEKKVLS